MKQDTQKFVTTTSDVGCLPFRVTHSLLQWTISPKVLISAKLFLRVCVHVFLKVFSHTGEVDFVLRFVSTTTHHPLDTGFC